MTIFPSFKTKKYFVATGLFALLVGCKDVQLEASAILHEDATVIAKIYTPSRHESELGMKAMNLAGEGFGSISMDYGGNIGMGIGNGLQISEVDVPEKYGAVFRCQHGEFTSEGSDERHKTLYNKLKEGENVDVTYNEIYRATYDDVNKDGKKELTERVLVGYDFLDAQPK